MGQGEVRGVGHQGSASLGNTLIWLSGAVLAVVLPAMVVAETQIDTPSGVAVLVAEGSDMRLSLRGKAFVLNGMVYASFRDRVGDVVLVSMASGGSACPALYAWLDTRPGMIRLTQAFGTCSDLAEVSWDSEAVIVTLPSLVPGEGPVAFRWDGKALTQTKLAVPLSGQPPMAGVAGWFGRHPGELLAAPEWRPAFASLMGEAALQDALRIIQVGGMLERDGDWVAAGGCQPHACDVTQGAVAVSLTDGRIVVALWEEGVGVRVWGDVAGPLPQGVAEVLARQ